MRNSSTGKSAQACREQKSIIGLVLPARYPIRNLVSAVVEPPRESVPVAAKWSPPCVGLHNAVQLAPRSGRSSGRSSSGRGRVRDPHLRWSGASTCGGEKSPYPFAIHSYPPQGPDIGTAARRGFPAAQAARSGSSKLRPQTRANSLVRFSSSTNARLSRALRSIGSILLTRGSVMRHCASIGLPGNFFHHTAGSLSPTLITKSITGADSPTNRSKGSDSWPFQSRCDSKSPMISGWAG